MSSSLPGYDAWLERPYQDACDAAEAYWTWCEARGFDPDTEEAADAYQDYIDSQWETYDSDYEPEDYAMYEYEEF